MRRAYWSHAVSAHAGSLALTARTRSLATSGLLDNALCGGRLRQLHGLAAPHFLEVVEVTHRRMHDVHDNVAEIDQHPFAVRFAFNAVDACAVLPDLVLDVVGERLDLARRIAARDHHALEHGGHARGVVDEDVVALDVLEGLDHHALFLAEIHQR